MGTAIDIALAAAGLAICWTVIGGALVAVPVHIAHCAIRNRNRT